MIVSKLTESRVLVSRGIGEELVSRLSILNLALRVEMHQLVSEFSRIKSLDPVTRPRFCLPSVKRQPGVAEELVDLGKSDIVGLLVGLLKVSIDRLGPTKAGFSTLLKLAEKGVWVKATAFGRVDFEVNAH